MMGTVKEGTHATSSPKSSWPEAGRLICLGLDRRVESVDYGVVKKAK